MTEINNISLEKCKDTTEMINNDLLYTEKIQLLIMKEGLLFMGARRTNSREGQYFEIICFQCHVFVK